MQSTSFILPSTDLYTTNNLLLLPCLILDPDALRPLGLARRVLVTVNGRQIMHLLALSVNHIKVKASEEEGGDNVVLEFGELSVREKLSGASSVMTQQKAKLTRIPRQG